MDEWVTYIEAKGDQATKVLQPYPYPYPYPYP